MAKKRSPNKAKKAAAKRSQWPSSTDASWLRRNGHILAVGGLSIVAVLWFATWKDGANGSDKEVLADGHRVPSIDSMEVELDEENANSIRDFLNEFVCQYEGAGMGADAEDATHDVDIPGYCHPRLSAVPRFRTQRVSSVNSPKKWWSKEPDDPGIPAGELVMTLPRPLQIWDLDALRDGYIQQQFLGNSEAGAKVARHGLTQNLLDSGAYLAVYLLRLSKGSTANSDEGKQCKDEDGECKTSLQWGDLGEQKERTERLSAYLDILPTEDDRTQKTSSTTTSPHSHPLFWSSSLLKRLFPTYTTTYELILHYQQMIESEYSALKLKSADFGKHVNYLQYLSMRINVLSRAFGLPAAGDDSGVLWGATGDAKKQSFAKELASYETSNFGRFLQDDDADELKLRSMCPLLDMYNSHPNPNVAWKYDRESASYQIRATKNDIPPGHSVVVSYGKYTDGHLFAKYGYVNGDGSSSTEISLAVFHRLLADVGLGRQYSELPYQVLDPDTRDEVLNIKFGHESGLDSNVQISLAKAKQALKAQTKELLRYLIFDDGYADCLDVTTDPESRDAELKLLKLQHLIRTANERGAWVVRIPPKAPEALPNQRLSSGKHAAEQAGEKKDAVAVNANKLISICRLLSLRPDDIDGTAIDYLEEGLTSSELFFVEKQDDALEYRAMMCVVRLCNAALGRYLGYDNAEPEVTGGKEWNAWYIITGEVRALGILQQIAASEANKSKRQFLDSGGSIDDAAIKVREEGACPLNQTMPLLSRL
ncbi:hypothetical protein ACHAXT_001234 [Thalassiosira profunda]